MACSTGSTIYYNIRELPEVFAIEDGNLLIVETEEGTNILDYANFIVDLDHTTFGETITQNFNNILSLSAKSATWDNIATTVNTYSAAWLSQGSNTTYDFATELPRGPSYSYVLHKRTLDITGTAIAKDTPPVDIPKLASGIILSDPTSYIKVDVGVSTTPFQGSYGYGCAFTILTAVSGSGNWSELAYIKTDGVYNSLNGLFTNNGTGQNTPDVSISNGTYTFRPGVSAVELKVALRLQAGFTVRINGCKPENINNSLDDANGTSYISMQEIPNYGYTNIVIDP